MKEIRQRLGMTQTQLANALGVNQSTVSRWERQICYPNTRKLAKLRELAADRKIRLKADWWLEAVQ